jgi:hypothetical protein
MSLVSFPPRDAGPILARALVRAEAAGVAEAARLASEIWGPWGGRRPIQDAPDPVGFVERAALNAAVPDLRLLTTDAGMVSSLAHGVAEEVMIRLRKRGAV